VYYLRIPYLLFFRPPVAAIPLPMPQSAGRWALILWALPALTGLVNLLLFGSPGWLLAWISGL
jgi:hypothetical protein